MTESEAKPVAKPAGKIRTKLETPWWVRLMRFVIAAIAAFLLFHAAKRFFAGDLKPADAWLIGMIGTLGMSAFVEAIWPDGNHGLLQYWCLTVLAASGLVSWAAGGDKWMGILGAIMLAVSFVIAALVSARSGTKSDAS